MMQWLNYHHLLYFWVVAREGTIAKAAGELMVSQPTISAQIKELEASIGHALFERAGRKLRLTEAGRIAFNYAGEIFSLGQEMLNALEHQPAGRPLRLAVGLADVMPKTVARLLLEPILRLPQPVRLTCREDKMDRLLADLSARRTDVVLSDSPAGAAVQVRGFNHLLAECGISFFAVTALARRYIKGFPRSLDGAPLLLPSTDTALRRSLNLWFESLRIHPVVVGEFDDAAMLNAFGHTGAGVFPVPAIVEGEIGRRHGVRLVGRTDKVRERYYAISLEEEPTHPAVVAICQAEHAAIRRDRPPELA